MLLICACAVVGAEQLIMGALKTNDTKRRETTARRPSLSERLTALESKVESIDSRIQALESTKISEPAAEPTAIIEQIEQPIAVEMQTDLVPTETPITELPSTDLISTTTPVEPAPIISLEDMVASMSPMPEIPTTMVESAPITPVLPEQPVETSSSDIQQL